MGFEVGQIAGDYEILDILGKGGMGRVYRVRNVISTRVEAMKALLADADTEGGMGDRFLAEIRILARLDHPNIAKFYSAFKHENQLLLLMEYVEGFTVAERLKQGAVPLAEAAGYIRQALSALSYAHANGIIHRDIKPANLMVTPQGIVKLMDFGIAKCETDPVLTRTGTTVGSLLYMSPEQVRGDAADGRSDLYSLGIVLYELTSGGRPFEADSTYGILNAHLNLAPRPAIEANPAIPAPVNDLIMTALAKDPAQRFQSADAFRKALDSVVPPTAAAQTQTIPAKAQPLAPPAGKRRGHRGLWMAAGAVVCVCVLAAAAIIVPKLQSSSAATRTAPAVRQPVATVATPAVSKSAQPAAVRMETTPPQVASKPVSAPPASLPAVSSLPVRPKPSHRARLAEAKPVSHPKTAPAQAIAPVTPPQTAPPVAVAQQAAPQKPVAPAGPSPEQIDAVRNSLIQLHARADAVFGGLNRLSAQEAANGLGLRHDMAASASRLTAYLQAADRSAGNNDLNGAREEMARAEQELTKLENFLGR
ncbi:MAG: protein kinase domain-containing protein [Bryobacteraceae bacterium]